MLTNKIRHLPLSVVFWVNISLKNCIQETREAIGLFNHKLGVSWPSKGGPYGLHKKETCYQVGSGTICEEPTPSSLLPFRLWCSFSPHCPIIKTHTNWLVAFSSWVSSQHNVDYYIGHVNVDVLQIPPWCNQDWCIHIPLLDCLPFLLTFGSSLKIFGFL
jgi:hypothetical protein